MAFPLSTPAFATSRSGGDSEAGEHIENAPQQLIAYVETHDLTALARSLTGRPYAPAVAECPSARAAVT